MPLDDKTVIIKLGSQPVTRIENLSVLELYEGVLKVKEPSGAGCRIYPRGLAITIEGVEA
jgi:hypothetical protein